MKRFQRLRHRLRTIKAALSIAPFSPSLLRLAFTMPRIAGAEDEKIEVDKAEFDRIKREHGESGKSVRKLEKKVEDLTEKLTEAQEKAEDGAADGDEAKKLQTKLTRVEGKLESAQERVKELESEISNGAKERNLMAVATRLNFRNPGKAIKLLEVDDDVDLSDESAAEKALKSLLKEEPYLAKPGKRQNAEVGKKSDPGEDDDDGDGEDGKSGKQSKDDDLSPTQRMANAYGEKSKSEQE